MSDRQENRRFICDYYSLGMTVIRIIRSTVPSGSIIKIDIPQLPEGSGIIQYGDIPAEKNLNVFKRSIPLLCDGKVRYEGEPILLLYGTDERALDAIASEITIEYDTDYTVSVMENYTEEQVDKELRYNRGKPEKNFEKAAIIVEEKYYTSAQKHYDLEPQGAFADIREQGIEITCATQWPFNVRDNVSSCLNIPQKNVTVNVPAMGKTHSGKLWYAGLLACYAGIVCWKTGRPAICMIPKTDSILYTPGRAASVINHRTGLDEDGKILCRSIDITVDAGAYPMLSDEMINRICFSAAGVYSVPALTITARSLKTNSHPSGAFNGMGFHQSFFAGESHSNSLAEACGRDPLDWRMKNIATKHINLPIGWESRKPILLSELLETVTKISDYKRKQAAYSLAASLQNDFSGGRRGIGLSICCQGNGFMGKVEENEKYTVSAKLDKEGSLSIFTSAVPENFQTASLWREIAGNILDIEPDDIKIETTTTRLVPDSGPSLFSRNITIITQLIDKCCNAIKKSRFRHPLPIEVKRSYRLPRTNGWDPESFTGTPFPVVSWGAAVVETETNPITLETSIRGIWFAADCGKIMNEALARADIESEIYNSITNSTVSPPAAKYGKKGIPLTPLRPARRFPVIIKFLESKEKKPGGIGELPDSLIPAALTEAVSMSLKIDINTLPTTPDILYRLIEHKAQTEAEKDEN